MKKILLLFALYCCFFANAQQSAERFFQEHKSDILKNTLGPSTCVTIDLSEALDTTNQPFTYVWELGDGTKKVGTTIKHCYPKNELYSPSLTLADSVLEIYMENEIVLEVDLRMDTMLVDSQDSISVGHQLKLVPTFSSGRHYNVESYFWDFGNGQFSSNTIGKMEYSETGNFTVRLGAIITKKDKKYIVLTKKTITVFNILTPKSLIDAFNNTQTDEDKVSRYLREDIHFTLFDTTHTEYQFVESIEKFGYRIELKKDCIYQIYARRGNLFSDIITFSTFNTKDQFDVQYQFKQGIAELIKKEHIHRINSLYFRKTKTSVDHNKSHSNDDKKERSLTKESKQEIKKVAILLSKYPTVKICIGSYTHTGLTAHLRFKKILYKDRALLIKKILLKKGVLPEQISYTTHIKDQTLINSCDGCSREITALNRRSEFKVIHIKEIKNNPLNTNGL